VCHQKELISSKSLKSLHPRMARYQAPTLDKLRIFL